MGQVLMLVLVVIFNTIVLGGFIYYMHKILKEKDEMINKLETKIKENKNKTNDLMNKSKKDLLNELEKNKEQLINSFELYRNQTLKDVSEIVHKPEWPYQKR